MIATRSRRARLAGGALGAVLAALVGAGCGAPAPNSEVSSNEAPVVRRAAKEEVLGHAGRRSLEQLQADLEGSVHKAFECPECHVPPPGTEGKRDEIGTWAVTPCSKCHAESTAEYNESVHGVAVRSGQERAARCVSCHGSHDIRSEKDPRSRIHKRNLPETCGQCHSDPDLARELGIAHPEEASHYPESVHGQELHAGNLRAPSCVDCHGKQHRVFEQEDSRSTVHPKNVPDTCGRCHKNEVERYSAGIHAQAMKKGGEHAPTCSTCHTAHAVIRASGKFKLASDRICGECHEERLSAYLETYHGRAHDLKSLEVAACFDCHGKHAILPSSNPSSRLSEDNRGETCRKCHEGAPAEFMGFMAHGDYKDRDNYPMLFWAFVVMTGLIVGTFSLWGVHTVMWMGRTLVVYSQNPRRFRKEKQRARFEEPGKVYVRFRGIDRFCHFLIIVSFFILVLTGMPLKFHDAPWAQWIFGRLGGAHQAAVLHRVGAVISGVYLLLHLVSVVGPIRSRMAELRRKHGAGVLKRFVGTIFGPDSPLPNLQDLRDAAAHVRWFVGRGRKPKFDRFTYWEKFDYFAELWGSVFIGLSGLVMWFPEAFTLVIPGWGINLAQIIHSQEALLAAGFILVFHYFNSHFRPEKFPLDTVMFSGRVTEEEMRHERARQLERLEEEQRLRDLAAKGEWSWWKRLVSSAFGFTALVLGTILAILMFWALGRLWFGS